MTSPDPPERPETPAASILDRILASAAGLADEGGFEAVRIRDVAARANVALGTLYKRFGGKDEILLAVLERELDLLDGLSFGRDPSAPDTYLARVMGFFTPVTRLMCAREHFTRAVLRAVLSGEAGLADRIGAFHARITALIVAAAGADAPTQEVRALAPGELEQLAVLLSQVWFSALVGWLGGQADEARVIAQVRAAAALLVRGLLTPARP